MSDILNGIWNAGANAASWVHQSVKEIPVAGEFYGTIAEPGLKAASAVKDYAVEFFKDSYTYLEPKAREYPKTSIVIGFSFVFFLAIAILQHIEGENKKPD